MSRVTALAVACCLLLAGCGGVLADEEPTREATVTPVPVTDKTDSQSPPGLNGTAVDRDRLEAAHRGFLQNRSFSRNKTTVVRNETGFVYGSNSTMRVGSDGMWWYLRTAHPSDAYYEERGVTIYDTSGWEYNFSLARFSDANTTYRRYRNLTTGTPEITVDPYEWTPPPTLSAETAIRYLPESVDQVERVQVEGRTFYRVTADTERAPDNVTVLGVLKRYRVTAYVTPEGFVKTVAVSYRTGLKYHNVRITHRDVGSTTVETPSWVRQVRANRTTTADAPQ
jgi:hypothetical protein